MTIRKSGRKYKVVHCSKGRKGRKALGTHATKAGAVAQHGAIQASKARRKKSKKR